MSSAALFVMSTLTSEFGNSSSCPPNGGAIHSLRRAFYIGVLTENLAVLPDGCEQVTEVRSIHISVNLSLKRLLTST